MIKHKKQDRKTTGFTIVELVIIVVIIAILAAIAMVSYGSWRSTVARKEVQSDLNVAAAAVENRLNTDSTYPSALPSSFKASPNVSVTYEGGVLLLYRSKIKK